MEERLRPVRRSAIGGIPLARILGIDVTLDPSWIIVVALLTFSLSAHFATVHPELHPVRHWAAALMASLVFFGCVLVHELSHSLVARRRGIEVHGITLFIFGGVSQLKGEPARPRDEFVIAGVGPLASAVLGLLFLGLSLLMTPGTLAETVIRWLGFVNLVLAGFNLLPGFPLDGGRIFRAIAWRLTGSLRDATRMAGLTGSILAYGLILIGILLAFGLGAVVNGLWLAFIGWFLLAAARSSLASAQMREVLGRLSVSQAMRWECPRATPGETVAAFVEERVLKTGERCFAVTEDDGFVGLATLHEIKQLPRERWPVTRVEEIMVPLADVRSVAPEDSLLQAMAAMDEGGVNQLPVLEQGKLAGMLKREDMLRLVALHLELGRG